MTGTVDKLAWFAAALAVVIWAFLPTALWAFPVMFPAVPSVSVSELPPVGLTVPTDTQETAKAVPDG